MHYTLRKFLYGLHLDVPCRAGWGRARKLVALVEYEEEGEPPASGLLLTLLGAGYALPCLTALKPADYGLKPLTNYVLK